MKIRELQPHELQPLLHLYSHLYEQDNPLPPTAKVEVVWLQALANPRIDVLYRDNVIGTSPSQNVADGRK